MADRIADFEFSPPVGEAEHARIVEIIGACFCLAPDVVHKGIERVGPENVLVARRRGEVLGLLYLLPFGQFFGGRSVPAMGIAAVGIAPEHRGSGVAKALMQAALAETRRRGVALSTLFPATHTLYRRCGYELAGAYNTIKLDPAGCPLGPRDLTLRPITPGDASACENLYRQIAAEHNGWIERTPKMWLRVREPWEGQPYSQLVLAGDQPVGYCYYRLDRHDAHSQTMRVLDMVASTPAAAQRLLGFFAHHRSLVKDVIWHGPVNDPLLMHLPEHTYSLSVDIHWMVRLIDVQAALTQRGYARGVSAEIHLAVEDDLLAHNTGNCILRVAGGEAVVRAGGEGRVRCDVRGLASLYTGFMTPAQLVRAGYLSGAADDLDALGAIFAGDPPTMADYF